MSTLAPLISFLGKPHRTVLVIHDAVTADAASKLGTDDLVLVPVGEQPPERQGPWGAVVLMVEDVATLRRTGSLLPKLGRSPMVAVWLAEATSVIPLIPRPMWPAVVGQRGRAFPTGGAFTGVLFAEALPAHVVLQHLARTCARTRAVGVGGLHVALAERDGRRIPAADSGTLGPEVLLPMDAPVIVPPDVVIDDRPRSHPVEEVIGRAPVVVTAASDPVGPLDEAILNPCGYLREASLPVLDLDASGRLTDPQGDRVAEVDPRKGISPTLISTLRPYKGVHLTPAPRRLLGRARDGMSLAELAHIVAALAMAGVPVYGARIRDEGVRSLLGPRLEDALATAPDLDDPLRRDEYSAEIRRAALLEHSTLGWRERMARAAGISPRGWPTLSVLLPTKRPQQLEFALRQVARQRGVDVELVLAAHGFEPDLDVIRERAGDLPVVVRTHPAETLFGEVLGDAARVASGAVLVKMDDDDWYGPNFLLDLLLARHHSGADLVGSSPEFLYLAEIDRTLRRTEECERYVQFVAGGTMMIDAAYLADVGGFRPVRRYVDAQLLHAVHAAGGTVYRTHGLGYVVRRTGSGHTWEPGLDYFLDESRVARQWDGFRPSRVLEVDSRDVPASSSGLSA